MVKVQTDTIGAFLPGTAWSFTLTAPANEEIVAQLAVFLTSTTQEITLLNAGAAHPIPALAFPEWVSGQPGQLRVQIEEPTLGVVEQTDVPIVLDRQTGLGTELRKYMEWAVAAAGQGLTPAEHQAVLQTNVGVIAMAGIDPLGVTQSLLDAMGSSAPLAFGSLGDIMAPLTGDGALAAPPAVHLVMGLYFVATTIPAGLGHRHGQSEEYPARLVQWRTTHVVNAIEMVTEILDATSHRELWRFRTQSPHAVEYSILPGVVIAARYWLFP